MSRTRQHLAFLITCGALALGGCASSSNTAAPPANPPLTAAPTSSSSPSSPTAAWNYLSADAIDIAALLPAPADHFNPKTRAFETRLTAQVKASAPAALIAVAEADEIDSVWLFQPIMGPNFTSERCPKIALLFKKATADANRIKNIAKDGFTRTRPDTAADAGEAYDPNQPQRSEAFSYPSGHATRAAMCATLLAAIAPEHEEALLREAWFMCLGRMVRGVHFPTDITAGFILGQAIARALLESPDFQRDLAVAREEWRAASAAP